MKKSFLTILVSFNVFSFPLQKFQNHVCLHPLEHETYDTKDSGVVKNDGKGITKKTKNFWLLAKEKRKLSKQQQLKIDMDKPLDSQKSKTSK